MTLKFAFLQRVILAMFFVGIMVLFKTVLETLLIISPHNCKVLYQNVNKHLYITEMILLFGIGCIRSSKNFPKNSLQIIV